MIVDLYLNNKTVVVVGGGIEGSHKVRGLVDQNCNIIVIINRTNRYLSNLEKQGKISIVKSKLTNAKMILDNYKDLFLIIAATNDKILNQLLVDRGRQIGAFAYASDDPQYSDFSYLSLIPMGYGCQIGISTSGRSPIMARRIRIRAERALHRIFNHDLPNSECIFHIPNRSKNYIQAQQNTPKQKYSQSNFITI
jgi:precorrin-2 dehydrogenase/sirohydrochlorin ferrochelatase